MRWTLADRQWHPVDDGALPYALAALRSLWVWPLLRLWSASMGPGPAALPGWPVVFGLLAASTAVTQVIIFRMRSGRAGATARLSERGAAGASGLIAVFAALYVGLGRASAAPWDPRWLEALAANAGLAITTLLIAVWLWWWGMLAGRQTLHYDIYAGNFALGLAGLSATAMISYTTRLLPLSSLLGPALAFFVVSLAALAVASLRSARRYERDGDDAGFRVSRYWLGSIGGVVLALVAAGLLLAQLLTPDVIRRILAAAAPLVDALAYVLYWILLAAAWLIFTPLEALARLLGLDSLAPITMPAREPPPNLAEQLQEMERAPVALAPGALLALKIAAGLLIAGVIVLIFALAFRRFRTYFEEDVEEVRESILSLDLLRGQLAQLLQRRGRGAQPAFVAITGDDPRAQIRRTYQALLAWAAGEAPRPPGMTPTEYLAALGQHRPERRKELAIITELYVRARYATAPLPASAAEEAQRAWQAFLKAE